MTEEVSRLVDATDFVEEFGNKFMNGYFISWHYIDGPHPRKAQKLAIVMKDGENIITNAYHFNGVIVTETYDNYHIHTRYEGDYIGSLNKEDYVILHGGPDLENSVDYSSIEFPIFVNDSRNELVFTNNEKLTTVKFNGGKVNNLVPRESDFMYDELNRILVYNEGNIFYLSELKFGEDIVVEDVDGIYMPAREEDFDHSYFNDFVSTVDKLYRYNIVTVKDRKFHLTDANSVPVGKS